MIDADNNLGKVFLRLEALICLFCIGQLKYHLVDNRDYFLLINEAHQLL